MALTNCTLNGNSAPTSNGGGLYNDSDGTVTVTNTIVANSTSGGNCAGIGGVTDGGHNLDSDGTCGVGPATNPMLDPAGLANNGGPTQTIALQAGSPAINAGDESVCAAPPVNNLDQRDYVRPGAAPTLLHRRLRVQRDPFLSDPPPTLQPAKQYPFHRHRCDRHLYPGF